MSNLIKFLGVGLLGYSMSVSAADDEQHGNRGSRNLDTDGDGQVSLQEFQHSPLANIERLDTDNNGVLSIDELLNYRPGRRGNRNEARQDRQEPTEDQVNRRQQMMTERNTARFNSMDVDGDEIVTADEYLQGVFASLDSNQDNVLTGDELRRQGGARRGRGAAARSQN